MSIVTIGLSGMGESAPPSSARSSSASPPPSSPPSSPLSSTLRSLPLSSTGRVEGDDVRRPARRAHLVEQRHRPLPLAALLARRDGSHGHIYIIFSLRAAFAPPLH